MKHVTIYTDGSCLGNPGPGGWGATLSYRDRQGEEHQRTISGHLPAPSTNNLAELTAATEALHVLKEPCQVTLYADSEYVILGMQGRVTAWQARGWRTADKKPVANQAHWQALLDASSCHQITWSHVRGHAGDPGNEAAHTAAERAAHQILIPS